jgi:hypothetical protein
LSMSKNALESESVSPAAVENIGEFL